MDVLRQRSLVALLALLPLIAGCRNDHPSALLQPDTPYAVSVHYLPSSTRADDGTVLTVPPELASWTGTLVITGGTRMERVGVLDLVGKERGAHVREQVAIRPQGDGSTMALFGTSFALLQLPPGERYAFQLDDFLFRFDGRTASWQCRQYRNAAGIQVDATFLEAPAP